MTVMVDEVRVWPTKIRCFKDGSAHLTADTVDELHAFAARLGLRRTWFQPLSHPHYDLVPRKHAEALELGATFVPAKEQARARIAKRATVEPTASEALLAAGYTHHRATETSLARDIIRVADGVTVARLKASEVWDWLREQQGATG